MSVNFLLHLLTACVHPTSCQVALQDHVIRPTTSHHGEELLKVHVAVAVGIGFPQHAVDPACAGRSILAFAAEHLPQLLPRDPPVAIQVESPKGGEQHVALRVDLAVHGRCHKLCVVQAARTVAVHGTHQLFQCLRAGHPPPPPRSLQDLLRRRLASAAPVQPPEELGQLLADGIAPQLLRHGRERHSLQRGMSLQAVHQACSNGTRSWGSTSSAGAVRAVLLPPLVGQAQGHARGGPAQGVVGQELCGEQLRVLRHMPPVCAREAEFAAAQASQHLLIVNAVKWWVAAEQHVQHHAGGPHVAQLVVGPLKHLGRHVVRRANARR
mmetsp:Transcript_69832/g.181777  ORF Transcript_69832/g.181777 Transcript_69832/m.181777 type:complete len:325 (-) Transcript_69832:424-1398(-)